MNSFEKYKEKMKPENPAPTKYFIDRSILKKKPYENLGPSSSFKATVRRKELTKNPSEIKKKLETGESLIEFRGDKVRNLPGPGHYEGMHAKRTLMSKLYGKKHTAKKGTNQFLSNIDRFSMDKDVKMRPGPGRYNIKSHFSTDRYRVYGSVFMSESERNAFQIKKISSGFGPYSDKLMGSQQKPVHFNPHQRFI